MLKTILTACAVSAALLASHVTFAQTDTAGESRAAPSKPSTKEEKKSAKQKRHATGKETAAKGDGRNDKPETAGTAKVSKDEKANAKSSRKKAGAETAKKGSAGGEAATMGTK